MSDIRLRFQKADPAIIWLLSGLLVVIAPHILYQSIGLVVAIALLLVWRLLIELKFSRAPPGWLNTLCAIAAFVGITYSYQTIFGRDAGVGLLITMSCLKLMEMHSRRDFMISVFLGYFVVITGFLFSQTLIIGMFMTTAVFLLTTALVSYHRQNKSFSSQYKSAKLAMALLIQSAPLAILLFFLFPRIPGPLWGLPDEGHSGKTGLSSSMLPGQITELAFDNSVAFRVQFGNDKIPDSSKLYWRGPVFTYYDGYMWQDLASKARDKPYGEEWIFKPRHAPDVNKDSRTEYTVTMEANKKRWLLALDLPTKIPLDSYITDNHELLADEPVNKVKNYTVVSYTDYKLQAQAIPENKVYKQVPQFIGKRARELVAQMRNKTNNRKPSDQQMVELVLKYFREQPFYYTRTPPAMIENPVDTFLFDERKGFCEHYASAFTTMMRLAGIPSRIVTGYLGGELNTIGDYLVVRQSDAHAWTEVWLADIGWTRVDPTAVIPPDRILEKQFRNRFRQAQENAAVRKINWFRWFGDSLAGIGQFWDNVNHQWNHWVAGYTPDTQQSFFDKLGIRQWTAGSIVIIMVGLMAVIILLVALIVTRHNKPQLNPAQMLFRRFCKKMARKGFHYEPTETANHFAERISESRSDLGRQISGIIHLYNKLRYARHAPGHSLADLERQVNEFKP